MPLRGIVAAGLWTISGVALVATGGLVYLRMTAPTWPRAIEVVALAPVAIPIACLALLSALALVPLTARATRRTAGYLALMSLLSAGLAFSWVAPLFLGPKPVAEGDGSLVIMAQNLEYGDPQAMADMAVDAGADLLVVTDAPALAVLRLRDIGMQRGLHYNVGVGQFGPQGTVIFSRYPVTDLARISSSGDSRLVRVHSPQLGDVDIVALHPRPPYQKAWTADYERITAYLRREYPASATANRPVVIAGDLNATLDHPPIRSIKALGFSDAVDQLNLGFQPTWPAPGSVQYFGVSVPPLVQIDHVLTARALVASSMSTYHCCGTDHLGLIVKIQRTKSSP